MIQHFPKTDKNTIAWLRSLQDRKLRQKYQFFLAEGHKLCLDIINHYPKSIFKIFVTEHWFEQNSNNIIAFHSITQTIKQSEIERISNFKSKPEIIIVVKCQDQIFPNQLSKQYLYLDGIQDPGNLGTILRIADWFGKTDVFVSNDTVDCYNPKCVQASMGSVLRCNVIPIDPILLAQKLSAYKWIGLDMNGTPLKPPFPNFEKVIFVLGSEGKGINESCKSLISENLAISKNPHSKMESLNAAIAFGILTFATSFGD